MGPLWAKRFDQLDSFLHCGEVLRQRSFARHQRDLKFDGPPRLDDLAQVQVLERTRDRHDAFAGSTPAIYLAGHWVYSTNLAST